MQHDAGIVANLGAIDSWLMIHPITQAAFAIYSNRGAYAFILGSGVSRGSQIKTGYEIVLDLADQIARLSDEDTAGDPEAWYRAKFNEDLDYSRVLERLGNTAAERQSILRHYFEPSPEERQRGEMLPTEAHRAIGALVAAGYVKVIITTNFDRLLEDAIAEAGVRPYVVRGAPDIEGMAPVGQMQCLVVKVHGDYLDTRIRNTPTELAAYDPALDGLLDRILDEYGLLVCGWSSDWDEALRNAVRRIAHRRLTTFWTIRGEPSQSAEDLIANRSAVKVPIEDADRFFSDLLDRVEGLDDLRQSPPLTVELAVAATKRYLAADSGRIRLRDLIKAETEATFATVAGLGNDDSDGSNDEFERRILAIEAATARLAAIAATTAYWGSENEDSIWIETMQRLGDRGYDNGFEHLSRVRGYAGSIVLYAACIGALAGARFKTLATLMTTRIRRRDQDQTTAVALQVGASLDYGAMNRLRKERENKPNTVFYVPASQRIRDAIRSAVADILPDESRFDEAFDRVEALVGLANGLDLQARGHATWFPRGLFLFRARPGAGGELAKMRAELETQGHRWPLVVTGLFPSAEVATELIDAFRGQNARDPEVHEY
jgi:hypothetical protein